MKTLAKHTMMRIGLRVGFFVGLFGALALSVNIQEQAFPDEPIAYVGHGAAFNARGKEIALTPATIESSQTYWLTG